MEYVNVIKISKRTEFPSFTLSLSLGYMKIGGFIISEREREDRVFRTL